MALWPAFIGPAYRARSQTIDAEALINLYLETTGSSGDIKKSALYGTPGSKFLLSVATADCRGCFSEDSVTLITVGNELYSLDLVNTAATPLGTSTPLATVVPVLTREPFNTSVPAPAMALAVRMLVALAAVKGPAETVTGRIYVPSGAARRGQS